MANIAKRNEGTGAQGGQGGQRMTHRRDPWRSLFDAMLPLGGGQSFEPSFDVRETKDAYVIEADIPGVEEKDLEVTLTGNRLQIEGRRESQQEENSDEGRWYCCERSYGSFMRAFTLPDGIDGDHASSDFKNGVLKIRVPKKPEAQPRRIALGQGPKTQA